MSKYCTVWYRITDSDYPQCVNQMVMVQGLSEVTAEKVARGFYNELKYILGDIDVQVWVE